MRRQTSEAIKNQSGVMIQTEQSNESPQSSKHEANLTKFLKNLKGLRDIFPEKEDLGSMKIRLKTVRRPETTKRNQEAPNKSQMQISIQRHLKIPSKEMQNLNETGFRNQPVVENKNKNKKKEVEILKSQKKSSDGNFQNVCLKIERFGDKKNIDKAIELTEKVHKDFPTSQKLKNVFYQKNRLNTCIPFEFLRNSKKNLETKQRLNLINLKSTKQELSESKAMNQIGLEAPEIYLKKTNQKEVRPFSEIQKEKKENRKAERYFDSVVAPRSLIHLNKNENFPRLSQEILKTGGNQKTDYHQLNRKTKGNNSLKKNRTIENGKISKNIIVLPERLVIVKEKQEKLNLLDLESNKIGKSKSNDKFTNNSCLNFTNLTKNKSTVQQKKQVDANSGKALKKVRIDKTGKSNCKKLKTDSSRSRSKHLFPKLDAVVFPLSKSNKKSIRSIIQNKKIKMQSTEKSKLNDSRFKEIDLFGETNWEKQKQISSGCIQNIEDFFQG